MSTGIRLVFNSLEQTLTKGYNACLQPRNSLWLISRCNGLWLNHQLKEQKVWWTKARWWPINRLMLVWWFVVLASRFATIRCLCWIKVNVDCLLTMTRWLQSNIFDRRWATGFRMLCHMSCGASTRSDTFVGAQYERRFGVTSIRRQPHIQQSYSRLWSDDQIFHDEPFCGELLPKTRPPQTNLESSVD